MSNLVYIDGPVAETAELLRESLRDNDKLHFTNGTYAAPAEVILPTTLAAFDFIDEKIAGEDDIFVIAINSDISMNKIMDIKGASAEERAALENQVIRAKKVAEPLAEFHSERTVFVVFYDEETPTALYNQLAELGFNMASLHKWGYGTNPDAPRIEGAHNFGRVFGFPFLSDSKAFCHDITIGEDQSAFVEVVNLSEYVKSYDIEPMGEVTEPNYDPNKNARLVFLPLNVPSQP